MTYFSCKCGKCRSVCCRGWGITLTESEYFRLLGLNCSAGLRRRLDCAFAVCERPESERYASVSPSYTGDCRLYGKDGLCTLQCELGESVLPSVCRQYPRSYKSNGLFPEAVCSASCEAVTEALMRKTPVSFTALKLPLYVKHEPEADTGKKSEIRSQCIDIIQDRSMTFSDREARLGRYLCHYVPNVPTDTEKALSMVIALINEFSEISPSIVEYGEKVQKHLYTNIQSSAAEAYKELKEKFENAYPEGEAWLENIAVNHMFYEQFPYVRDCGGFTGAYSAFCAALALIKVTAVCNTAEAQTNEAFADSVSASFRYIEHSSFYKNVNIVFRRHSYGTPEDLYGLAML